MHILVNEKAVQESSRELFVEFSRPHQEWQQLHHEGRESIVTHTAESVVMCV
jgi:hypothetical protein